MEYEKSYKGFVIWIILFCGTMIAPGFLPIGNGDIVVRLMSNVCTFGVAILTFIIYRNEKIYWYNGTTYEEALSAGSDRRKAFAWKHFLRFGMFALVFLIYSVIAQLAGIRSMIDFVVLTIGLVGVAFTTIGIKL